MQFSSYGSSKLLKYFSKSSFLVILSYHFEFLTCIIPLNTVKLEKMKSLSEAKDRYGFPKKVKFHFCPVFWAILRFYQQFHCKIYERRLCEPSLIFFLVIPTTLSFQIKKCSNSKNFVCFCGPKLRQNFEILQLVCTLAPNKSWTKCLRCLIFAQPIVFHPYFMEITTFIAIWLQLSHNGSSKLLKFFIKSIS